MCQYTVNSYFTSRIHAVTKDFTECLYLSYRHPLITDIHNFNMKFISFTVVLKAATVRDILAETGFLCDSAAVLSMTQQSPHNTAYKTYPNRTGMHPHCCGIAFLYMYPNTMTSVNLEILNKLHSSRKNTVFWKMEVYSLVEIYFHFVGTSSLPFHSRRVCRTGS